MADAIPVPTRLAGASKWADYLELDCLLAADLERSVDDLLDSVHRESELLPTGDQEDPSTYDVAVDEVAAAALTECRSRQRAARWQIHPYPFEASGTGLLRYVGQGPRGSSLVYVFLALLSALDMQRNKLHGGQDGTALFEMLSCEVLRHYLGGARCQARVFGTGGLDRPPSFQAALEKLAKDLGGGVRIKDRDYGQVKDDRVDLVAWLPFGDRQPGPLMVLAQCKTGLNWRQHIHDLRPDAFVGKWFDEWPAVDPVRAFFMPSCFHAEDRTRAVGDLSKEAGIIFDRMRILEYCPSLPPAVGRSIRTWTAAACQAHGLRL